MVHPPQRSDAVEAQLTIAQFFDYVSDGDFLAGQLSCGSVIKTLEPFRDGTKTWPDEQTVTAFRTLLDRLWQPIVDCRDYQDAKVDPRREIQDIGRWVREQNLQRDFASLNQRFCQSPRAATKSWCQGPTTTTRYTPHTR